MDGVIEAVKYLYGCISVEKEANLLYLIASEKLPCPELSTIAIALAQDNQKHAKMIKELCRPLNYICFAPNELAEDFGEIAIEIGKLKDSLSIVETIEKDELAEFIRSLADIEDCLHDLFANFLLSTLFKTYAQALYEKSSVYQENLTYIFETLKDDNLKHKNMLIESLYYYHKTQQKNIKPKIKYQNPDAWIPNYY